MEKIVNKLTVDPLKWVESKKTSPGIYLRRVVFNEESEDDKK